MFAIFNKKVKSDETKSQGFVPAWLQFKLKSSTDTSQAYIKNTQIKNKSSCVGRVCHLLVLLSVGLIRT